MPEQIGEEKKGEMGIFFNFIFKTAGYESLERYCANGKIRW